MKRHLATLALACAALYAAPDAGAQVIVSGPSPAYSPFGGMPGSAARRAPIYVPYNNNDIFPYTGKFYGKPYDPWTWPYMTGTYQAGMARYYYPPVR